MAYTLVIGLGNPGEEYEGTYHNVGFMAVDALAERMGERTGAALAFAKDSKKLFEYARAGTLVLVKPLTYMNDSGDAVVEALKVFNVTAEETIVFHDDSDLALGAYKISAGQGAAGQRGVASIIKNLGEERAQKLHRARIGIRPLEELKENVKRKKAGDFVLKKIKRAETKILRDLFEEIFGYIGY